MPLDTRAHDLTPWRGSWPPRLVPRSSTSVAHISFAGGGLLLPAREPYERELVAEHVLERVRRNGAVRVVFHGRTWSVEDVGAHRTGRCARCNRVLQTACGATAPCSDSCCVWCAFGAPGGIGEVEAAAAELRNRIKSRRAGAAPRKSVLAAIFQWVGGPLGRTAA